MRALIPVILSTILLLTTCGTSTTTENVADKPTALSSSFKIELVRFEQEMWANKGPEALVKIFEKHPLFARKFVRVQDFPDPKQLVASMSNMISHPAMDTIYQTTQQVFGDFSTITTQLQQAGANIQAFDNRFQMPPVYTCITGFGKDMLVSDSLIAVSLEFFLAEKCRYKPDFPVYILRRYRPEYIAPYIVSMISNKYIRTDLLDNALVSEMVYYGKMYYFLDNVLPNLNDTLITGFRSADLSEVIKNEDIIWAHLVNNKLLYETKHEITTKYIGERPNVYEIGNKCPGRVGRWVGWNIVKKYMERNPKTTLLQLLAEKDARKIFIGSQYNPLKN